MSNTGPHGNTEDGTGHSPPSRWFELHVPTTKDTADIIVSFLFDLGTVGCEEKTDKIVAYFPSASRPLEVLTQTSRYLYGLLRMGHDVSPNQIRLEGTEERDWLSEWKKWFEPVIVSDKIAVKPPWRELRAGRHPIVIDIDPGMAFGTGGHATTRLALRMLEDYLAPLASVLDVGTGSGILAIAAHKLGASPVFACDTDPIATRVAQRNLTLNGCTSSVRLWTGSAASIARREFDIVLANINTKELSNLLPTLSRLLSASGVLILSGILIEEKQSFLETLQISALEATNVASDEGWLAVAAKKTDNGTGSTNT